MLTMHPVCKNFLLLPIFMHLDRLSLHCWLFLLHCWIWQYLPIRATRFSCPACLEQGAQLEAREHMCLGIDDYLIEWQEITRREQKIEVFQCFGLYVVSHL